MMTFDAVDVFPERLTQMEGWEDYITDFDEEEHAPLLGYLEDLSNAAADEYEATWHLK